MIKRSSREDIEQIVELWYQVSIEAHDFIDKNYWQEAKREMKDRYLPMSETYIIEEGNNITGFISMVDNYLAAIFVESSLQSKGYGKKLLDFIKKDRDYLELKVYQKNKRAVRFYEKNDFTIKSELVAENLNEKEYLMVWSRGN